MYVCGRLHPVSCFRLRPFFRREGFASRAIAKTVILARTGAAADDTPLKPSKHQKDNHAMRDLLIAPLLAPDCTDLEPP
jgi:hypothetical protein